MKMKWYSDSGHAWLEVERKELSRLKISKEISEYSYQHGTKVYLEEDCDANVFFKNTLKMTSGFTMRLLVCKRERYQLKIATVIHTSEIIKDIKLNNHPGDRVQ